MIVLRGLFYLIIFYVTVVFFLPKNEIVAYVDTKFLSQEQISQKVELQNSYFGYIANNSTFLYQKNAVADIETIEINPYLFYNTLNLKKTKLLGMAGSIFPSKIENAQAVYSILDPTKILLDISGDFGKAVGYFDLTTFMVHLEVTASSTMKKNYSFILKNMKKSDKIYIYEYKL